MFIVRLSYTLDYMLPGIWLDTSNSIPLVTNSPQLMKVCDLKMDGNQTKLWTVSYMVATESPTVVAFKQHI